MMDLLAAREHTWMEGVGNVGRLLKASAGRVVYENPDGEAATTTVVELRRGDTPDAEWQLARWRERQQLSHPNLLQIYAAGQSAVADVPVIYAVMDKADESLEDVLSQRTLTQEEAMQMLHPALDALNFLHQEGYAWGSPNASAVLASGDSLKLSTESVLRIQEGGDPDGDTRAMGALLIQAVTGTVPSSGQTYFGEELSGPLKGIVQHFLDVDPENRWTAEQALVWLTSEREPEPAPREVSPSGSRRWIYAVAAAALVLVALVWWHTKRTTARQAVVSSVTTVSVPPVSIAPMAVPDPKLPEKTETALPQHRDRQADGWVVVIASYAGRGPAEKRARELAKKWPKFNAQVFEAPSERVPMLVVIGKNLSQREADALRQRAVGSGLPRDTYIKRIVRENG